MAKAKSIWGRVITVGAVLSLLLAAGFGLEHLYKVTWAPRTIRTWSQQEENLWIRHRTTLQPTTVTWTGGPIVLRLDNNGSGSATCTFWPASDLASNADRDPTHAQAVALRITSPRIKAFVWQGTPTVPAPADVICTRAGSTSFALIHVYTGSQVAAYDSVTSLGGWWLRVLIAAAPLVLTLLAATLFSRRRTTPAPPAQAPVGPPGPPRP